MKIAPLMEAYKNSPQIKPILVHTGQHYDEEMSDLFFRQLKIPEPDVNLGVGSAPHGKQTGQMLEKMETILLQEKPDICIVYGDTNSTLAGALAAAKLHIPVAHIEAGLRSFNRKMPEEINRVLTDHISSLLFCPTKIANENLKKEGIFQGVHETGDVMYDCILFYAQKAKSVEEKLLKKLNIKLKSYYLATVHRAENTDDKIRLANIIEAINELATPQSPVVFPLHPRTAGYVDAYGLKFAETVRVIEPVPYLEMITLESNAKLILTDSGGIQKEAYCLNVPCVTLREETEWVETVETGGNILAGADKDRIIKSGNFIIDSRFKNSSSVYGDGNAAKRVLNILFDFLPQE